MENKEDIYKKYKALVESYTVEYYQKVSDLFEVDELEQEVWLCVLSELEKGGYKGKNNASENTYLASCIRNHIVNLIVREIRKNSVIEVDENVDVAEELDLTPETLYIPKEIYDKLKIRIEKIKDGEFVLNHMHLPYRKISKIGQQQGLSMSISTVKRRVKEIKKIWHKMIG